MRNPCTQEKVYVGADDNHCGGLATICAIDATDRDQIMVEMFELRGVSFNWQVLLGEQERLARKYAGQIAHRDTEVSPFPTHDPHESGTLEAGLDAALALHNREETLLARAAKAEGELKTRFTAPIVCLCGSTRFMGAFFETGWNETLAGKIVLSVGVCKHAKDHGAEALGPEVVEALDDLHKRKIDLADEVLVLDVGGYIGSSTRSEIEYATAKGKPIRYLSKEFPGYEEPVDPVEAVCAEMRKAMRRIVQLSDECCTDIVDQNTGGRCFVEVACCPTLRRLPPPPFPPPAARPSWRGSSTWSRPRGSFVKWSPSIPARRPPQWPTTGRPWLRPSTPT